MEREGGVRPGGGGGPSSNKRLISPAAAGADHLGNTFPREPSAGSPADLPCL